MAEVNTMPYFLANLSLIKNKKSKWEDNGILNFLMQFSAEIQSSVWLLCPDRVTQLGLCPYRNGVLLFFLD